MLLLLLHFLQHGLLLELDQVAQLSLAEAQPKSPDTFALLFARITPESVFPFDEAAGVVAVALVAGAEVWCLLAGCVMDSADGMDSMDGGGGCRCG